MDWGGPWEQYLSLAEFAYNNNFRASIGMPPFEALYGQSYRSPLCWEEPGDRAVMSSELIQECNEKVPLIRQRLLTAQSRQKSYADRHRQPLGWRLDFLEGFSHPGSGEIRQEEQA